MRLVSTYPKNESKRGNGGKNKVRNGGNAYDADPVVFRSKNIVDHLLHGKSDVMTLSPLHSSPGSSLDIKVDGGKNKTTPPARSMKDNSHKLNKRKRPTPEYYQIYGDTDHNEGKESRYEAGVGSHGSDHKKSYNMGDNGEQRRRNEGSKSTSGKGNNSRTEKKNQRRKNHYFDENTYSTNKSYHGRGIGIPGSDYSDDLEIPVGQWIAILCAVIGIVYHHFGLGRKIPTLFKSNVEISKKAEVTGKKIGNGLKKGKKRKNSTVNNNLKTRKITLSNTEKMDDVSSTTTNRLWEISDLFSARCSKAVLVISSYVTFFTKSTYTSSLSMEKTIDKEIQADANEKPSKVEQRKEKSIVASKAPKKRNKNRKNTQKRSKQPVEESATPDSVSTDGSSSADEVDASYDDDQLLSIEDLAYDERKEDEGEWTTVGAVSSNQTAKKKESVAATPSPLSSQENKSPLFDKTTKVEEIPTAPVTDVTTNDEEVIHETIEDREVKSTDENITDTDVLSNTAKEEVEEETSNNSISEDQTSSDDNDKRSNIEDDAALARKLQKEEEERAAGTSNAMEIQEEDYWEEVPKKKRGKRF